MSCPLNNVKIAAIPVVLYLATDKVPVARSGQDDGFRYFECQDQDRPVARRRTSIRRHEMVGTA